MRVIRVSARSAQILLVTEADWIRTAQFLAFSGPFSSSIGSMATVRCKLRRASEARRMVLVLAPGFALVQSSSAQAWDDAVSNYRHALELEPNDALTHYNFAARFNWTQTTPKASATSACS